MDIEIEKERKENDGKEKAEDFVISNNEFSYTDSDNDY